jgi:hypothetical protein
LDKQVDDVLIAPLEKHQSKVNRDQSENSEPDESVDNAKPEVNRREDGDSLPIWLL